MVVQRDLRMKQTTASRIQNLTDKAMTKIGARHTITLQDGTTRRMREHLRVTFYTMESGTWKRCSKDAFVAKMDTEA
jgi:phage tail tube protein FII